MLFFLGRALRFIGRAMVFGVLIWACLVNGGVSWMGGDVKDLFLQGQILLGGLGLLPFAYLLEYFGITSAVKARGDGHLLEYVQMPVFSFVGYICSFAWFALSLNTYWFTKWGIPAGSQSVWPMFPYSVSTTLGFVLVIGAVVAFGTKLKFWYESDDDDEEDDD